MFKTAFTPALNKDGLSKLEFKDYELSQTSYEKLNKETGVTETIPYESFRLNFDVMGKFLGTNQIISVGCDPSISEDNRLGTVLKALGFEFPSIPITDDADGFAVADDGSQFDDDGFAVAEVDLTDLSAAITEFLDCSKGSFYVGKVAKNTKGYWTIDPQTIKPMVKKSSK